MRLRVLAFGLLGTLATLLAAALVYVPDALAHVGPVTALARDVAQFETGPMIVAATLVLICFLSYLSWRTSWSTLVPRDAFDEAIEGPPESVTARRQRLSGADLDDRFDAAVAGDRDAAREVRERLRETAARASARARDCDPDAAREAVRRGTWVEDRTAAATLSGAEGPSHPLSARLRLWLDPESERERRFRATVHASARLAGGGR